MQTTRTESAEDRALRERNFTYHPPGGDQAERYKRLRAKGSELAEDINKLCPKSRERSVAMTKLEEACFWANAAIARNETPGADTATPSGD